MLYRAFKRAARRAGLGLSARFHDLRHICNTRIKAAGLADLMDRAEKSARDAGMVIRSERLHDPKGCPPSVAGVVMGRPARASRDRDAGI